MQIEIYITLLLGKTTSLIWKVLSHEEALLKRFQLLIFFKICVVPIFVILGGVGG